MTKNLILPAGLLALVALCLTFGTALAHTGVNAGNYAIEVGWLDEPPVVGQRNAIVVNVADTTDKTKTVDVSRLLVSLNYGGQTKALTLQPLSEAVTNQYIAPVLPLVAGEYTLQLRGQIGDGTNVNLDVQPEEVVPVESLAFPSVPADSQSQRSNFGLTTWLAGGALLIAMAALVLAVLALQKTRQS